MTRSRTRSDPPAGEAVIIREQLADEEIDVLRALLTRVPVIAHTSSLRVQGSTLLAPRFSIPVGQGYVEISALAKESPRSGFTYHRLHVRLVEHPTGLAKVKLATGKTVVGAPQSSVVLVSAGAPITRIEVFQHRESDRDEVVVFDCALIFERDGEGTFGVETPGVMLDAVELSLDPTAINAMRGKRRSRLVISG